MGYCFRAPLAGTNGHKQSQKKPRQVPSHQSDECSKLKTSRSRGSVGSGPVRSRGPVRPKVMRTGGGHGGWTSRVVTVRSPTQGRRWLSTSTSTKPPLGNRHWGPENLLTGWTGGTHLLAFLEKNTKKRTTKACGSSACFDGAASCWAQPRGVPSALDIFPDQGGAASTAQPPRGRDAPFV